MRPSTESKSSEELRQAGNDLYKAGRPVEGAWKLSDSQMAISD